MIPRRGKGNKISPNSKKGEPFLGREWEKRGVERRPQKGTVGFVAAKNKPFWWEERIGIRKHKSRWVERTQGKKWGGTPRSNSFKARVSGFYWGHRGELGGGTNVSGVVEGEKQELGLGDKEHNSKKQGGGGLKLNVIEGKVIGARREEK